MNSGLHGFHCVAKGGENADDDGGFGYVEIVLGSRSLASYLTVFYISATAEAERHEEAQAKEKAQREKVAAEDRAIRIKVSKNQLSEGLSTSDARW
jgi:hypothetical protein